MDLGTGLTVLGSTPLLLRLLGPTADYVGERARGLVEKCDINLNRVLESAVRRAGGTLDDGKGVSPRVLKHVYDEARFTEDALATEYLGGLLAGSRSDDGNDESVLPLINEVKSLSAKQLRMHYLCYYSVLQSPEERPFLSSFGIFEKQTGPELVFLRDEFVDAIGFPAAIDESYHYLDDALRELTRRGLIYYPEIIFGSPAIIKLHTTNLGAQLFVRSLGYTQIALEAFFSPSGPFDEEPIFKLCPAHFSLDSAFASAASRDAKVSST